MIGANRALRGAALVMDAGAPLTQFGGNVRRVGNLRVESIAAADDDNPWFGVSHPTRLKVLTKKDVVRAVEEHMGDSDFIGSAEEVREVDFFFGRLQRVDQVVLMRTTADGKAYAAGTRGWRWRWGI